MEYFIVLLSIFTPLLSFTSNFLRNKKNESFLFLVIMCAFFQLILGPFNMIGFNNYSTYSIIVYILFIFGIISGIIYTFFPFFKLRKEKTEIFNLKKNFLFSFSKNFLIPWVMLVIVSIFSLFFQSHFWDSSAYKLVSLNFREGEYHWGGLGNSSDDSYFLYRTSAGYYVASVLSTVSIAFMYNYVWVVIFYSFFIFFVWDFYGELISDEENKKTIISKTILLFSSIFLIFLHHYVISAANITYAAMLILLAIYCIKKNNLLYFFFSVLFVQFFTITGNLIVLPFVLGIFIYLLIFKRIRDLISFILLFLITMIGSLSLFIKPSYNVFDYRLILFSIYLSVSIIFLIGYLLFKWKVKKTFWDKKIISFKIDFYSKKSFIIFSSIFWIISVVLFLVIFYISQYDKAYTEIPFVWCITAFGMSVIYYCTYITFYRKKIRLSNTYAYQLIQMGASTIFLLFYYLLGNAYQIGVLDFLKGIWNSSTWRLLMTIPGVDLPYAIFIIYSVNIFYLFKNLNLKNWESFFTKIKFKKEMSLNKINKNLIVSSLAFSFIGSILGLGIYSSLTANDSTVITSNVFYLNDFNNDQKNALLKINDAIKKDKPYSKNIILADTPVFEYVRYANDYLGYNYNYTNYGDAQNKKDFANYSVEQLWNIFSKDRGLLDNFLSINDYNFKMIILDKHTYYFNYFNNMLEKKIESYKHYENNWYTIWYT